jgi:hypothetical protein
MSDISVSHIPYSVLEVSRGHIGTTADKGKNMKLGAL